MLLGKQAIQKYIEQGAIVCNPAPEKIEAVHIDLHLGGSFWYPRASPQATHIGIDRDDPKDFYRFVDDELGALLLPHGFCLAHTEEYAGTTVPWLCPFIETRSTMARWGIAAHVSAGWGDPGFCGRWTLELFNHRATPVYIPAGARICSIGFHQVEGNDAVYTGRYNPADWTPEAMLPRVGNV